MVIDQEKFPQVVREWLSANGVAQNTPIELHFLDDEVIIRPQSAERQELRDWLESRLAATTPCSNRRSHLLNARCAATVPAASAGQFDPRA